MIIPELRVGLRSQDPHKRQGVCLGLTEIMKRSSKGQMARFLVALMPAIRRALCDDDKVCVLVCIGV